MCPKYTWERLSNRPLCMAFLLGAKNSKGMYNIIRIGVHKTSFLRFLTTNRGSIEKAANERNEWNKRGGGAVYVAYGAPLLAADALVGYFAYSRRAVSKHFWSFHTHSGKYVLIDR